MNVYDVYCNGLRKLMTYLKKFKYAYVYSHIDIEIIIQRVFNDVFTEAVTLE